MAILAVFMKMIWCVSGTASEWIKADPAKKKAVIRKTILRLERSVMKVDIHLRRKCF